MLCEIDKEQCVMEIKLEDLNSNQWEKYLGAYGNMSNLMSDFMKDPDDKELQESVYQGINHQMTFYSAVYLVKLLEQKILSGDIEWAEYCLFNVGMTLASDNILARRGSRKSNVTKELKRNYRLCVKKLKKLARRFYKENKDKLKHKEESFMANLSFKGFRIFVYIFVTYIV